MYKEPHPADLKDICPYCYNKYYLCEGCPCQELLDEEWEEKYNHEAEPVIDYIKQTDHKSDEAQFWWEAWRMRIRNEEN